MFEGSFVVVGGVAETAVGKLEGSIKALGRYEQAAWFRRGAGMAPMTEDERCVHV